MRRHFTAAAALVLCVTGCKATTNESVSGGGTKLSASQSIELTARKSKTLQTFAADISESGTSDGKTTQMVGSFKFRLNPSPAVSADFSQLQLGGQNVSGSGQVVFLNNILYVKVPILSPLLSGGRPWFKVSLNGIQTLTGVNVTAVIGGLLETTPLTLTRMFTASSDVHDAGRETVDGVPTTHFQGSVTIQAALSRLDATDRSRLTGLYRTDGSNKISFDVWVDDQHRPRRSTFSVQGTNTPTSTTITYRYGQEFQVSAPPADQVGGMG
ncbi:MAG TPA: hypothetical protein VNW94_27445 [Streptosporangiaceae bacterium]|nr:hypothetical protein [Streptosporangiaceae bacterium]